MSFGSLVLFLAFEVDDILTSHFN